MLYLIRHGQTDWNKVHKLPGTTDIPLNEAGEQMAQEARTILTGLQIDCCYVSPLHRAVRTAEILLEGRDTPLYHDDRLKEISFGKYEGTTDYFTNPDNPVYPLFHDPEHFDPRGIMESFEELNGRTRNFLLQQVIPLCRQGKNVLVVAHGAVNQSIYTQLHEVPLSRFWDELMKNCEVRCVEDGVLERFAGQCGNARP